MPAKRMRFMRSLQALIKHLLARILRIDYARLDELDDDAASDQLPDLSGKSDVRSFLSVAFPGKSAQAFVRKEWLDAVDEVCNALNSYLPGEWTKWRFRFAVRETFLHIILIWVHLKRAMGEVEPDWLDSVDQDGLWDQLEFPADGAVSSPAAPGPSGGRLDPGAKGQRLVRIWPSFIITGWDGTHVRTREVVYTRGQITAMKAEWRAQVAAENEKESGDDSSAVESVSDDGTEDCEDSDRASSTVAVTPERENEEADSEA
jgi:hypothetical protein